jgi:hypothetical protein
MIDRRATMPVEAGVIVSMVTELEEYRRLAAVERPAPPSAPSPGAS